MIKKDDTNDIFWLTTKYIKYLFKYIYSVYIDKMVSILRQFWAV